MTDKIRSAQKRQRPTKKGSKIILGVRTESADILSHIQKLEQKLNSIEDSINESSRAGTFFQRLSLGITVFTIGFTLFGMSLSLRQIPELSIYIPRYIAPWL